MIDRRLRFCYWYPLLLLFSIGVAFLASGCLWGMVTDANTGASVGGATVKYADSTGHTGTMTADANGVFILDQSKAPMPAGPVNFVVEAEGYEPLTELRQVGLSGAQNFALKAEPGTYSNAKWGFSIKFPEDWMVAEGEEQEEGAAVMAAAPPDNVDDEYPEFATVVAEDVADNATLEMLFQFTLKSLKESPTTSKFKEVQEGEVDINGRDARWALVSFSASKVDVKMLIYMLKKDQRAYIIMCEAQALQYSSHQGELEGIAKSFRIY